MASIIRNIDKVNEEGKKAKEDIDKLLSEREKTHGSFKANAQTYENIIIELQEGTGPDHYTNVQALALAMITVKLARIKSSPNVTEHWKDIAGYAQLVVNDLEF